MKRIYIQTLGCPKNFNDSEVASGILEAAGHNIITDENCAGEADIIIVNTCGFINDAKLESIDAIFEMARLGKTLIVSGCLSQRYGEELFDEMPEVACFIGVNEYENLPGIIENLDDNERQKYISPYEKESESEFRLLPRNAYSASLKISEGCNNRCTYCVIPYIRGPYRSRPKELIVSEALRLERQGVKELMLIAQDTTAYGTDIYGRYKLPELLRELCQIDGIEWVRIMYAYEDRITSELIEVMASEPKICNYIDIPLQHSSNKILKAMDRRSTRESILATIKDLRAAMPDIHIRTTLITGFPGESEEDFENLRSFVEEMKFERLGVFAYSPEEGTVASEMPHQIPDEVKEARRDAIMRRQLEISLDSNKKKIGKTLDVMLEEKDICEEQGTGEAPDTGNSEETWVGRSRYDASEIDNSVIVRTRRKHEAGDIIKAIITDGFDYDLVGEEV